MTQEAIQQSIFWGIIIIGMIFYFNQKKSQNTKQQKSLIKRIKETKCSCQACGNIWYYGKAEESEISTQNMQNCGNATSNLGNEMMCCGGCLPALFIPPKQMIPVKDLKKCPKCNSSAIKKEEVAYEI